MRPQKKTKIIKRSSLFKCIKRNLKSFVYISDSQLIEDCQIKGETEADYEFKWQGKDCGFGCSFFLLHSQRIYEGSSSSDSDGEPGKFVWSVNFTNSLVVVVFLKTNLILFNFIVRFWIFK